jgi:hypothetical protein
MNTTSMTSAVDVAYVTVPLVSSCIGALVVAYGVDRADTLRRRNDGIAAKSMVDRIVKNSLRVTFVLAAFIATLSFSLTPPQLFESTMTGGQVTSLFSWHTLLRLDTVAVKNMLHGCFLVGGYTNWTMTGNIRYATIIRSVLMFMIVPSLVATILNIVQVIMNSLAGVYAVIFYIVTIWCVRYIILVGNV